MIVLEDENDRIGTDAAVALTNSAMVPFFFVRLAVSALRAMESGKDPKLQFLLAAGKFNGFDEAAYNRFKEIYDRMFFASLGIMRKAFPALSDGEISYYFLNALVCSLDGDRIVSPAAGIALEDIAGVQEA